MAQSWIECFLCRQGFLKENKHIHENSKLGYRFYCSFKCHSLSKNKQDEIICENPSCERTIKRKPSSMSQHNFCSRSCATSVNNYKFPKVVLTKRKCDHCGNPCTGKRKYCSIECKAKNLIIAKEEIIKLIGNLYEQFGRIPLKREFQHSKAARTRFGSWNKAIEAAGFESNPVLFAKRQFANDGHLCDSLAEKIIDDWFFARNIEHQIHIRYPNTKYTADFVVNGIIIEFFGLSGELSRYDELMKGKLQMIRERNLKVISIYPKDIFPMSQLDKVLKGVTH
jgi:hypothetical protein